ncbi:MAG: helix-turn-helix domain-containing protein [Alsobacter sp.]
MERPGDKSMRRPRSDAARNRLRLLEAAKAVFGAGGPEASLEAVAREAGVGIGTLYRHFPRREALFEAVYRREVDDLVALAGRLAGREDPVEALRDWLRANVAFVATKRGMAAALAVAASKPSELTAYSTARLTDALAGLLGRAAAAGAIRADVAAPNLLKALIGMCLIHDGPGWQDGVLQMIDVLVAGLVRPAPAVAAPLSAQPPR